MNALGNHKFKTIVHIWIPQNKYSVVLHQLLLFGQESGDL